MREKCSVTSSEYSKVSYTQDVFFSVFLTKTSDTRTVFSYCLKTK